MKLKVSPTKRPALTKRRANSEDWDVPCPDKMGANLSSGRPPLPPKETGSTPATAKKKKPSLITHSDDDRKRRVNALIAKNEATPGFFIEAFQTSKDRPNDRWFMQVTSAAITNKILTGIWCKANCLTLESSVEDTLHLGSVKDYGENAMFLM